METITSRQNPVVKAAFALQRKRERQSQGRLLVEGAKCVEMALESEWRIERAFFNERFLLSEAGGALASKAGGVEELYSVPEPVIRKLSTTDTPCPVIAVAKSNLGALAALLPLPAGRYVVAHRTSDPGNLGTLIRIALAAGAKALFLTGDACEVTNPKVVRSSMGALFHLPVVVEPKAEELLGALKKAGIQIVAADPGGKLLYSEVKYPERVAFLLGEESAGLEPGLLAAVDQRVRIPVAGPVGSLNVAVSGAVLLYEVLRQESG